jgi:hypothetical protein
LAIESPKNEKENENENAEHKLVPSPCVAEIQQLCVQFQRAIAALASDEIAELESSTAAQDDLIEKLQTCFRGQLSAQQPSIKISPSDFTELVNLTRVYALLLRRASRTVRLRAALCQTYKQNFPAATQPVAATGWSCEV